MSLSLSLSPFLDFKINQLIFRLNSRKKLILSFLCDEDQYRVSIRYFAMKSAIECFQQVQKNILKFFFVGLEQILFLLVSIRIVFLLFSFIFLSFYHKYFLFASFCFTYSVFLFHLLYLRISFFSFSPSVLPFFLFFWCRWYL